MSDFVSPEGRLSFPALFVPKSVKGGTAKFSATLLLPKDGVGVPEFMNRVGVATKEAIEAKWPNPSTRPAQFKMSIKDGDTALFESGKNAGKLKRETYHEMANCWVIAATTLDKPPVFATNGNPIVDASKVYAGCWVRMSFDVYAYDNVNVGVSCGLQGILKTRDDAPFGNVSRPEIDFADYFTAAADDSVGIAPAPQAPQAPAPQAPQAPAPGVAQVDPSALFG